MDGILGSLRRWVRLLEGRASRLGRWAEVLALLVVIAVGVWFRLDDLGRWKEQPTRAFVHGEPIAVGIDAFRYLATAQDLIDGTYHELDEQRGVPDPVPRRSPPPLLSVLAAGLSEASPFSLTWIAAILPVVLGPLLAIPVYLLGRSCAGPIAGLVSAQLAVLYSFFVARTNVGRFDTDCLNVAFATNAALLCLGLGARASRVRYGFFLGALLNYLLFLWWWDQAPAVVTAMALAPLVAALLVLHRPTRREALLFGGAMSVVAIGLLWSAGFGALADMIGTLMSQYALLGGPSPAEYPNMGLSIDEMARPSLATLVAYTSGSLPALAFGLLGAVWLSWRRPREASVLVGLGALTLTIPFGNRFVIFLVPLLALGTGFLLSQIWRLRTRWAPVYGVVPLLLVALLWPLQATNQRNTRWPSEIGPVAAGMRAAATITPDDAVIWAWWDHGHALNFWARRATVDDGALVYKGERAVYDAIPLVVHSQRLAANFMHFYVIRGMRGLHEFYESVGDEARGLRIVKQVLAAGPEAGRRVLDEARLAPVDRWRTTDDWLRFFFPRRERPVYLFLDELLMRVAYWWHWFGTWDVETHDGRHAPYVASFGLREAGGRLIGSRGLELDLQTGNLRIGDRNVQIEQLAVRKEDGSLHTRSFDHRTPYRFELSVPLAFGALMNAEISASVFNQLFLHEQAAPEYFRLVESDPPYYELWEVDGDRLPDASEQ